VVEDGYEFFAKRQLVTLFSAPNYCGEFDNAGAMMSVDETLMCSFQVLRPHTQQRQTKTERQAQTQTDRQGETMLDYDELLYSYILGLILSELL